VLALYRAAKSSDDKRTLMRDRSTALKKDPDEGAGEQAVFALSQLPGERAP
jgi:hypothetical protein